VEKAINHRTKTKKEIKKKMKKKEEKSLH